MATNQDRDEQIRELADSANELLEKVTALGEDTGDQIVGLTKRAKRNRKLILMVAGSLALDVLLTGLLAFGIVSLRNTDTRVDKVTSRLDNSQTVQRQKALCPLYGLFLGLDSPQARAASTDKAQYDKSFKVIREGYEALKCSEFEGPAPTLDSGR